MMDCKYMNEMIRSRERESFENFRQSSSARVAPPATSMKFSQALQKKREA